MPLPRRTLLQVLGASGVLVLSGCEMTTEELATPAATPSAADLLAMTSRRLADTPTVHFVLDVQGDTFIDNTRTIRLLGAKGDLKRPDRVRTTFQADILGRAVSLQLVTIGDRSWTTNILTGKWEDAPLEFTYRPDIIFSTQEGIGPVMGRVQDVEALEDEEVAGRLAHHLRATVEQSIVRKLTYNTIRGSPVTADLWIDQETHDLLRARLSEPPGPDRPHPAVWTLDLSHFGEEITIEPPA